MRLLRLLCALIKDLHEGLRASPNQNDEPYTLCEALCYIGMVLIVLGSMFAMVMMMPA